LLQNEYLAAENRILKAHSPRNLRLSGKGNVLLFPHGEELPKSRRPSIECSERLGGLLKYYHRLAG
jgi:hypothetical protein